MSKKRNAANPIAPASRTPCHLGQPATAVGRATYASACPANSSMVHCPGSFRPKVFSTYCPSATQTTLDAATTASRNTRTVLASPPAARDTPTNAHATAADPHVPGATGR